MARITRAGGPVNWREAFLSHPGLPVTPENYERLLAAASEPEPGPAPEAEPEAEPVKAARPRGSLA